MKTIEWHLSNGLNGCDRSGEVEVEDEATETEILEIVREEMWNFMELSFWEKKDA